jgi:hypothetical protein
MSLRVFSLRERFIVQSLYKTGLLLLLFAISQVAFARVPTEAEFSAAKEIGDDISDWYQNLPERPQSVTIFSTIPS